MSDEIKVGDKVRVKDRPDWAVEYKLANSEGRVVEVREEQGFAVMHLEKTNTGIDIGTSLSFRLENVEKI